MAKLIYSSQTSYSSEDEETETEPEKTDLETSFHVSQDEAQHAYACLNDATPTKSFAYMQGNGISWRP